MAKEAYYNRVMSARLEKLLTKGGKFDWLIDYVKGKDKRELDFQNIDEKFSLYRGTSKVFSLKATGKVDAEGSYKTINKKPSAFYDDPTKENLDILLQSVEKESVFKKYIKDKDGNYNEGWYQSIIGRRYSFETKPNDELLIFDKEWMAPYNSTKIRDDRNDELRQWQTELITEVKTKLNFSKPTSVSAKLDLVGISKEGKLWLIEVKQDANTKGIYNSPFQIGIYYKRMCELMNNYYKDPQDAVSEMLKQKERLGLIKPQWELPQTLQKEIKLAVVVGGSNIDQVAKDRFPIIQGVIEKNINNKIHLLTCEADGTLKELKW